MKKQNYDERQLIVRGKAFRLGSLVFFFELVVWEVLREITGISAEPLGELCMLIAFPFAAVSIRSILEDAYDPIDTRPGMFLFAFMPLMAIIVFILHVKEGERWINGRCLTTHAGVMCLYVVWVIISAVYWIKYAKDTKIEKENRE